MLIQLVIQLVGSEEILAVFHLLILRVTLQTQHTQIHQFTQHEQLLHFRNLTQQSRTQRSRLLPQLCVYLLLHSRILSLLFVVLLLCVLDSLSVFHPLRPFSPPMPPTIFSLSLALPTLHLSTSHLPMTKYPFSPHHPSCFLSLYLSISSTVSPFLTLSLSSFSSLAPSIRKRTSIPTVHSGATPSAP